MSTWAGLAAKAATSGSGCRVLQIEALQEVLKKLKSKRIPIYEKKYGQVPMVRLWGHPLPMFSQEEMYHLESYTCLLSRMWLNNSGNRFAEFCEIPFVSTASPGPLVCAQNQISGLCGKDHFLKMSFFPLHNEVPEWEEPLNLLSSCSSNFSAAF